MTAPVFVGRGCSPLGRRHEVTVGEASPPRNTPAENTAVKPYDELRFASRDKVIYQKGPGRSKPLPYNRRCRGFVGERL